MEKREVEFSVPTHPALYDAREDDRLEGRTIMDLMRRSQEPFPDPAASIYVEEELPRNVAVTTLDSVLAWARKSSLWPVTF